MNEHEFEKLVRLEGEKIEVQLGDQSLTEWIAAFPSQAGAPAWMLAFADDGVIWGKAENGAGLLTSVPLDVETLQSLHLFGEKGELRVWKQDGALTACWLKDQPGVEYFDQSYMMWGTQVEEPGEVFSLVADGRQGLRHAVPFSLKKADNLSSHPLRLVGRSYLAEDADGQVFVSASRLLKLLDTREVK